MCECGACIDCVWCGSCLQHCWCREDEDWEDSEDCGEGNQ
jgi:hypothetical protein